MLLHKLWKRPGGIQSLLKYLQHFSEQSSTEQVKMGKKCLSSYWLKGNDWTQQLIFSNKVKIGSPYLAFGFDSCDDFKQTVFDHSSPPPYCWIFYQNS